jgi:hypothetical protein
LPAVSSAISSFNACNASSYNKIII